MTGAVRQNVLLRLLFGALVALVLATRLLAPSGFMPVRTSEGIMVTLCTGQGAIKMLVERERVPQGKMDPDKEGMADAEHCPFAGIATAPALPAIDPFTVLPVWHLPTGPIAFALRTGWIARLAAPPPPASGPPADLD